MIKRIFLILIVFFLIISIKTIIYNISSENENIVVDFIKKNPTRSAILLKRNDSIIANRNPHKIMQLASTVKIIIAIEYSYQVKNKIINPDEKINLNDINKFYIENTDGNTHKSWLNSVSEKISNNKVSIKEIAKGMMKFSSNANTEWLIERLGIKSINSRINTLGLKNHSPIYYIVSALYVSSEIYPKLKGKELKNKMKLLTHEKYIEFSNLIHTKLKTDSSYKKKLGKIDLDAQKIWSNNLPSSTVYEYVSVMKKINSRVYFDKITQENIEELMEYVLDKPKKRDKIPHIGMKEGTTISILTKALYSTDKENNKTEIAYFFNDLTLLESIKLQKSIKKFDLALLTNPNFRNKVKMSLE